MLNSKEMRRTAARVIVLTAAVGAMLAIAACNTVSGVGKDLQESSDTVKEAIEN